MRRIIVKAAIASFFIWFVPAVSAGQYILYMESSPGDYIGQGSTWAYTDADVSFRTTQNWQNGASVYLSGSSFDRWINWNLDFSSATGAPLEPGYYGNATRYPFNHFIGPTNGLAVGGMGRGCNRLSGDFTVREVQYGSDGGLEKLAVDFTQRCEEFMPPLVGSLRFNSDVPLNTLFPPTISFDKALNSEGCIEAEGPAGTDVRVTAESSQNNDTLLYEWTLQDGVTWHGAILDLAVGVDESASFSLTATDPANGNTTTVSRTICVSDTTPPIITILNPRSGDIVVGNNLKLDVVIKDVVDVDLSVYKLFMGSSMVLGLSGGESHENLAKPGAAGERFSTTITVEATDKFGNTAQESVEVVEQHDKGKR